MLILNTLDIQRTPAQDVTGAVNCVLREKKEDTIMATTKSKSTESTRSDSSNEGRSDSWGTAKKVGYAALATAGGKLLYDGARAGIGLASRAASNTESTRGGQSRRSGKSWK